MTIIPCDWYLELEEALLLPAASSVGVQYETQAPWPLLLVQQQTPHQWLQRSSSTPVKEVNDHHAHLAYTYTSLALVLLEEE
jgi:hypothetical protein